MGFLSIFTESSVVMTIVALIFLVFAIRCLLHGVLGATSTLIRVLGTVIFVGLAYYFWEYSASLHGTNMIDQFVYDSWAQVKSLASSLF